MIILFDLDGTLIDSTEAILESFHHAFALHNHSQPDDAEIKALIGHPLDYMFGALGVPQEKVWDFVDSYKEHYRKISTQKTELLPYAKEAIELASEFAHLGIVTTKTGEYSKILMEHFGVMEKFVTLIGREHVQNPKPDPEPILKALESFSAYELQDVYMIGDTEMDLISAQEADINGIGVLGHYATKERLLKYTATIFNNAYEAVKYLKSIKQTHN